ncbi:hypothetical protein VI817_007830 [Penicillium citrinum]|nr:hypothetical protein VI817_007830 [Penicillium citrinum]
MINDLEELGSTTYLVTCPASMAAGECGVLGSGMAVIKSPTFVQVINVDNDDKYVAFPDREIF